MLPSLTEACKSLRRRLYLLAQAPRVQAGLQRRRARRLLACAGWIRGRAQRLRLRNLHTLHRSC